MSAFIVISTDKRLHYLVDGIEKCRPLNNDISVKMSIGKITKSDSEYTYEYLIHGEGITGDGVRSFSDLFSNQLAAFRLAYAIPSDELINIFFLENPLQRNELNESEFWLEEFDKVYNAGHGYDTNFCLFRVVFTYNHANPSDISAQIDSTVLERLLKKHIKATSYKSGIENIPTYERYLFYIDNQKTDAAALCLNKVEHDLKMPRILIDFMMLVSSRCDRYNVIAAINPATVNTRCFSIGYGESMYYYPDVERYYIHADNRDIHFKFLTSGDEIPDEIGKISMDVEKYPFGLRQRKKRLGIIYEDIPFTENITNYNLSADYIIDECIVALHDLLIKEREKEFEDFNKSTEVTIKKQIIDNFETQIASAQPTEDESPEEYEKRIKQLCSNKEKAINELDLLIQQYKPECPSYIDRHQIYRELCVTDDCDIETQLRLLSDQYQRLIEFTKSKKFYNFINTEDGENGIGRNDSSSGNINDGLENENINKNYGCLLSWLLFWKKKNQKKDESLKCMHPEVILQQESINPGSRAIPELDYITRITEQLKLKECFVTFKNIVSTIECVYEDEKKYCEEFKLTTHTNHYFPLINSDELVKNHARCSDTRIQTSINLWRSKSEPRKSDLIKILKDKAVEYTKDNYSFINWEVPFPFLYNISEEENFQEICNGLQKLAAPMVSYNLTSEIREDKVSRYFFSDRPNFKEEMERIRSRLNNGNELTIVKSTHIASKICMFQFLPMDDDVLQNLVDLLRYDTNNIDVTGIAQQLQVGKNMSATDNINLDGVEPSIENKGDF